MVHTNDLENVCATITTTVATIVHYHSTLVCSFVPSRMQSVSNGREEFMNSGMLQCAIIQHTIVTPRMSILDVHVRASLAQCITT